MTLKFKDIAIEETFEFDHSNLSVDCLQIAHGPWVKTSARKYQWLAGGSEITVGSINAKVRRGKDCGRR